LECVLHGHHRDSDLQKRGWGRWGWEGTKGKLRTGTGREEGAPPLTVTVRGTGRAAAAPLMTAHAIASTSRSRGVLRAMVVCGGCKRELGWVVGGWVGGEGGLKDSFVMSVCADPFLEPHHIGSQNTRGRQQGRRAEEWRPCCVQRSTAVSLGLRPTSGGSPALGVCNSGMEDRPYPFAWALD
jgi:hypothetical protein